MGPSAPIGLEVKSLKAVDNHIPRAIQVMLMSEESSTLKTIGEHGVDRLFLWMKLFFIPSMFMVPVVAWTYKMLCDEELILAATAGGGFLWWLLVPILLLVYLAIVQAAGGHLGLLAPQTPYFVWEALNDVGFKKLGLSLILTSGGALLINQASVLIIWTCLLAALVAATIAFWICLLRTYGGGGGKEKNSRCSEAVIDCLAHLYCRILYEFVDSVTADAA